MDNQFSRTELLINKEGIEKLKNAKVAIFGIGGVGSYVVESLARAGVGNFILVDNDIVSISNLNRQLIATHKTVGMPKVEVSKNRILEINPDANIEIFQEFFFLFSAHPVVVIVIDGVHDTDIGVRFDYVGETGNALGVAEDVPGAGDDADAHFALCHKMHEPGRGLAGAVEITAHIGKAAGIFDIGVKRYHRDALGAEAVNFFPHGAVVVRRNGKAVDSFGKKSVYGMKLLL